MQEKRDYMQDNVYIESVKLLISSALYLGKAWGWTTTDVMSVLTDGRGFALLAEEFEMAGYKEMADAYFGRREA